MDEKIEEFTKKYEDFWSKHNLTSRISVFIFLLLYIFSVVFLYFKPIHSDLAKVILDTTSYVSLISVLAIIFGPNTFVKIAEVLSDKKFQKYTNKFLNSYNSKQLNNNKIPKPPKDL